MYKLYTINYEFIEQVAFESKIPSDFTGIIEYEDGDKSWLENGLWHRMGAPAYLYENGREFYYINGNNVSKEEHDLLVDIMKLKGIIL